MSGDAPFALVTGASSGIGLAISRELARRNYSLLMVSNEEEQIAKAAVDIAAEFRVNAIALCMDLAKSDSAQKLFDYCVEQSIKVEILINNAGIFFYRDIINTAPDRIETMLNLHIITPTMLTRLFAEQMIREKSEARHGFPQGAYILNISSITAWMMMPGIALYGSTKAYLRSFSRAMRNEIFDSGVSITTICPGAAATGLYNLAPHYLKLGIRLGIIIKTERLARLVLKKMFQKKHEYIPAAFVNRLFMFLVNAMPENMIRWLKRKVEKNDGRRPVNAGG